MVFLYEPNSIDSSVFRLSLPLPQRNILLVHPLRSFMYEADILLQKRDLMPIFHLKVQVGYETEGL
jgi:hypothetical protein